MGFTSNRNAMNMMVGANGLGGVMSSLPTNVGSDDLDSDGHLKTVDERAFRDFGIDGSEKEFRQIKIDASGNAYIDSQNKTEKDVQDFARDQAMNEMREAQEKRIEKMYSMYGYEFSVEAMQETAKDALSDFERLVREKGWSPEEADAMHNALLVLADPNSTREEQIQALKDIEAVDPDFAKDFAKDASRKDISYANTVDPNITATEIEQSTADDFLADSKNDFYFSLDKPDPKISAIFTDEVDNIGANAQSFVLDEAPQVAAVTREPEPFVLDA